MGVISLLQVQVVPGFLEMPQLKPEAPMEVTLSVPVLQEEVFTARQLLQADSDLVFMVKVRQSREQALWVLRSTKPEKIPVFMEYQIPLMAEVLYLIHI